MSEEFLVAHADPLPRRSRQARVVWGDRVVTIGGDAPVRVQSMTNTDTVDVIGTAIQVKELAIAGSEMVRITVNTPEAAAQVRFRNRQRDPMEYKAGAVGRFMPLSVAMTSYKEQAAGDMEFTLRLRAAKRGPVLGMRKGGITVEGGHKYLVEANPVGRAIFFKFEDEGWVQP